MWSTVLDKNEKSSLKIPILFDFQLKVHSICTIMWEEFTTVVLNNCVIWNWNVTNCRRCSATPIQLQLIQSHICIFVLVFCELQYFFGDLMIARRSYYTYFQQHCCIYQDFIFWQIMSGIHGFSVWMGKAELCEASDSLGMKCERGIFSLSRDGFLWQLMQKNHP